MRKRKVRKSRERRRRKRKCNCSEDIISIILPMLQLTANLLFYLEKSVPPPQSTISQVF